MQSHRDMSTPPPPNRSFTNGMQNIHPSQGALQNGNSIVYMYNSSEKPYRPMTSVSDEFLEWLDVQWKPFNVFARHGDIQKQQRAGTGTWALESKWFREWKDGDGRQLLWLHGNLGCGKTVLVSHIVDHLEQTTHRFRDEAYVFLYFGDDVKANPSYKQILAVMLRQLLAQQAKKGQQLATTGELRAQIQLGSDWDSLTDLQLEQLFLSELRVFDRIYLVVDALDKYSGDRGLLTDVIKKLPQQLATKVLISARSESVTTDLQLPRYEFRIDGGANAADIEVYVRARANDKGEKNLHWLVHEFQDKVIDQIVTAANGLFLVAKEHLDWLSEQSGGLGALKSGVFDPPAAVYKTFGDIIANLERRKNTSPGQDLVRHVFTWLSQAQSPITSECIQLSHAAGLLTDSIAGSVDLHSPDALQNSINMQALRSHLQHEDSFITACEGLVFVHRETQEIRFVHDAVPNLISKSGCLMLPNPHVRMAKHCLGYLLAQDYQRDIGASRSEEELPAIPGKYPFLSYAATHWPHHLQRGLEEGAGAEQTAELALVFLKNTPKVTGTFDLAVIPSKTALVGKSGVTGLHVAVLFDQQMLIRRLVDETSLINIASSNKTTPLHLAIKLQKHDTVQFLLKHSADRVVQDGNGDTPLHLAVAADDVKDQLKYEAMLKALISGDAAVCMNIPNNNGDTPFRLAIRNGPSHVARVLAENQPRTVPQVNTWSALREVMSMELYDESAMVELVTSLLEAGADVNKPLSDGWLPLSSAIERNLEDITRLLLSHGADANIEDLYQETPLIRAIKHDQTQIFQLLVRGPARADINRKNSDGSTPLIYAAKLGREEHAWLLLQAGALLDEQDSRGCTALHRAIAAGHGSLVWLLLAKGANPNIQSREDKGSYTPLHLAVKFGDVSIASLLCVHGARLDLADGRGMPPLHRAVQMKNEEMVRRLLLSGDSIYREVKDSNGSTALFYAIANRDLEMVKLLLRYGASCRARNDKTGATVLHHAIAHRGGLASILVVLLGEPDIEVDAMDSNDRTPLALAAEVGWSEAVLALLEREKKPDTDRGLWSTKCQTARDIAEKGGHHTVVFLIDQLMRS